MANNIVQSTGKMSGSVGTENTGRRSDYNSVKGWDLSYASPSFREKESANGSYNTEQTYTIQTKNKQYTLTQSQVNWLNKRYKQNYEGYYGFDDEDQWNKANGIMPRSFQNSYTNTQWDNQLRELELPAASKLEPYLEELSNWYGDGSHYDLSSDVSDYTKAQWQSTWEYEITPEDMKRQKDGIMPAKVEAKFYDKNGNTLSYADQYNLDHGLPPVADMPEYIGAWNTLVGNAARIDEFYMAVANDIVALELQGIRKDDTLHKITDEETGETRTLTGAQIWDETYAKRLIDGQWNDIFGFVTDPSKKEDTTIDYGDAVTASERAQVEARAIEEQRIAAEKQDPYALSVSYEGFLSAYTNMSKDVAVQNLGSEAGKAVAANISFEDAASAAADATRSEMFANITDRDSLVKYIDTRENDDPSQILHDLYDNGIAPKQIRQAREYLLSRAATDEEKAAIKNTVKEINSYRLKHSQDDAAAARERNRELKDLHWEPIASAYEDYKAQAAVLDFQKMSDLFEQSLNITEDGYIDEDSIERAVQALVDNHAPANFINDIATAVVNENNLLLGDSVYQRSRTDLLEYVRSVTAEVDRNDRRRIAESARTSAVANGVSEFEFDQLLRMMDWEDVIDKEQAAVNYLNSKDPTTWAMLTPEAQAQAIADFIDTEKVNPEIYKSARDQLVDRMGYGIWAEIGLGLASGAVNATDMLVQGNNASQWEISKTLSRMYQEAAAYGKGSNEQSFGTGVMNLADTLAVELIRMKTLGLAGGGVSKGVTAALGGGVGTAAQAGFNSASASMLMSTGKGVGKAGLLASKYMNGGINTIVNASSKAAASLPFIMNASGNYFAEAMAAGATREQATAYGLIGGTFEGALEALNVDSWASKGLGSKAFAKTVMEGGSNFTRAGLAKKANIISIVSSAIGEFVEESTSYASQYWLQRLIYNADNGDYDWGEFVEQGLMGSLIGIVGAASTSGVNNASRIMYDYLSSNDFDPKFFDLMVACAQTEMLAPDRYASITEGGESWLTYDEYASVQRDIANHNRYIQERKADYEASVEKIKTDTQAKEQAFRALESQVNALGSRLMTPDVATELGRLSEAMAEAQREWMRAAATETDKVTTLTNAYTNSIQQSKAALEKAQSRMDTHNVALYNMFIDDIAALRGLNRAELEQERATESLNTLLRDMYDKMSRLDEYDLAAMQAAEVYGIIDSASSVVNRFDGTVQRIMDKMNRFRTMNRASYNAYYERILLSAEEAQQQEAEMKRGEAVQTEQPNVDQTKAQVQQKAQEAKAKNETAKELRKKVAATKQTKQSLPNGQKQIITIDDRSRAEVENFARSIGRPMEWDASLADGENGKYVNGVLYLNPRQFVDEVGTGVNSPAMIVLKHELTHFLEGNAKYYNSLSGFIDTYARKSFVADDQFSSFDEKYASFAEDVKEFYRSKGITDAKELDNLAHKEFVASFVQDNLFRDQASIDALVESHANVGARFLNYVQHIMHKLGIKTKQTRNLTAAERELKDIERRYIIAFNKTGKRPSEALREYASYSAKNDGAEYSTGLSFDNYLRNVEDESRDVSDIKADYDAALNNNDEDEMSDLVREYAGKAFSGSYAREADGSMTDLYHGTKMGGFTVVNTDVMDDHRSIFATNSRRVALSYIPQGIRMDGAENRNPLWQGMKGGTQGSEEHAGVYHLFGNAEKPFVLDMSRSGSHILRSGTLEDVGGLGYDFVLNAKMLSDESEGLEFGEDLSDTFNDGDPVVWYEIDLAGAFDIDNSDPDIDVEIDYLPKQKLYTVTERSYDGTNKKSFKNKEDLLRYAKAYWGEHAEEKVQVCLDDSAYEINNSKITYPVQVARGGIFMPADNLPSFMLTTEDEQDEDGLYHYYANTRDVSHFAQLAGFDSVIFKDLVDLGWSEPDTDLAADIYIFYKGEQLMSADPVTYDDNGDPIPLNDRGDVTRNEFRYSTGRSWNRAINRHGAIPQGAEPRAHDIQVPRSTDGENRVSQAARTIMESGAVTDADNLIIQKKILAKEDGFVYNVQHNKDLIETVRQEIADEGGIATAARTFHAAVKAGDLSSKLVAKGEVLLMEASRLEDQEARLSIAADLCLLETEGGRAIQAFAILKELGGVGAEYYSRRLLERVNSRYNTNITVDEELFSRLGNANSMYEIEAAQEELSRAIGEQLPLSLMDRLNSWRYFSMLANPTTHMRNLCGNAIMYGVRTARNAVAAAVERQFTDKSEWTHAVYNRDEHSAQYALAQQMFQKYKRDLFASGGKYGIDQEIASYKRSAYNPMLNAAMKGNELLLEKEDQWFVELSYVDRFTQYLVAQGIDPSNITQEQERAAHKVAAEDAFETTFKDASKLAAWLNRSREAGTAVDIIRSAVLPFTKTPINIAKRGFEYSPAGFVYNAATAAKQLKDGVPASKVVEKISSGLTGTGLTLLGALLAKAGILRGLGDEDEKIEAYNKATGAKDYSIVFKIDGEEYAMNASGIAPANIPLFMGVRLWEAAQGSENGLTFDKVLSAVSGLVDPMMEMSFLSSLDSALNAYGGSDAVGGNVGAFLTNAAGNYASQYVPSALGNLASAIDPVVNRSTQSGGTKDDGFMRSIMNKVPFLRNSLEAKPDVKGEVEYKDTFGEWMRGFANSFILAGKVTVRNRDAIDDKLIQIVRETGDSQVLPTVPTTKKFTHDKKEYIMDASQIAAYRIDLGNETYVAIKALMRQNGWDALSAEEQAKLIKDAISDAKDRMRDKYLEILGAYDE